MNEISELNAYLAARVPQSLADALVSIARQQRVKTSVVMRWALENYINAFFSSDRTLKDPNDTSVFVHPPV